MAKLNSKLNNVNTSLGCDFKFKEPKCSNFKPKVNKYF